MTSTESHSAVDAEAVLESIEDCLDDREYDSALRIGEHYLSKIDNDSEQAAFNKFRVRAKIADVMYKLKSFERCLEQYEHCRMLAENYVGLESDETMEIIFKIERTLGALSMLEKIGSAEAELKSKLVSQYLLQSQSSTDLLKDGSEKTVDAQFESELLENLWADALEKQEKLDQSNKKKKKAAWIVFLEEFANKKEVQAVQLQLMLWGTAVISLGLLFLGANFLMNNSPRVASVSTQAELEHRYKRANHAEKLAEKLDYQSTDGLEKLILRPNETATVSIGKSLIKGKLIFYDDSFVSSVLTVVCSNLFPTEVFQCRGCSIVSPTGAVFFDNQASDFKLVKEMDHLAKRLNTALISKSAKLTESSDLLNYTNPQTMKPQKVIFSLAPSADDKKPNSADSAVDTKPGSILLRVQPDKPQDFHLIGFYSKGRSFAAERDRSGWKSLFPVSTYSKLSFGNDTLFIMCEQEFDSTTRFFKSNLKACLIFLAMLGVLVIAILIRNKFKGAQLKVRSK